MLALTICPVAEHIVKEAVNGRGIVVEEVMRE
jgi:hypothetical protein